MDESLRNKQEKLFRKLWKVLHQEKNSSDSLQDSQVRQAIRRMFDIVDAPDGDYELIWEKINRDIQKRKIRRTHLWHQVVRYAAMIVLPLFCAGIAWYLWKPAGEKSSPELAGYIRPRHGIILTLADGQKLDLQGRPAGELLETAAVGIHKDSLSGIVYQCRGTGDTTTAYHTLEIPVAADYRLRLSDGTVVFLNSETTLRYPEIFAGQERKVYLEGEAYFEVAKDSLHPFKVIVNQLEVEVLGTHFNINAYPERSGIATTLAEGKVKVTNQDRQVILKPGEQALASENALQVREVEVQEFTSWKDGLFRFRQMPLEEIMIQVYRWYGIKAEFMNPDLKTMTFTGVINKNLSAGELFRIIESVVEVRFSMDKENHVIVTTK